MKTIALFLLATFSCAAGATGTGQASYNPDNAHYQAPPIPAIPAAAHAACADKSAGSTLTHVIAKGETMTGTCAINNGKLRFDLHSYSRRN